MDNQKLTVISDEFAMLVLAFLWESGPLPEVELRKRLGVDSEKLGLATQSLIEQGLLEVDSSKISLSLLGREFLSAVLPDRYLSSSRAEKFFGPLASEGAKLEDRLQELVRPIWFENANRSSCSILVGRRGAGKTTLARYLALNSNRDFERVINIDPERAFTAIIEVLGSRRSVWIARYAWMSWILAEIASRTMEALPWVYDNPAWTKLSHRALSENGRSRHALVFDLFTDLFAEWSGSAELPAKRRATCEAVWSSSRAGSNATRPTLVIIDSFDQYGSIREDYTAMFAGLITACESFRRETSVNATVKCFVSKVMFDSVTSKLPNPAKLADATMRLEWNAHQLREVAERRVATQLGYLNAPSMKSSLHALGRQGAKTESSMFSLVVKPTARSRTERRDSFVALLEHTMFLPRHVVLGLNCLADESAVAGGSLPARDDVLDKAILRMSRVITDDLISEYESAWPGFASCFYLLQELPKTFGYSEMKRVFTRNGLAPMAIEAFFLHLFDSGAVGVVRSRDRGTDLDFSYSSKNIFWSRSSHRFALHPAVAVAIGATQYSKKKMGTSISAAKTKARRK